MSQINFYNIQVTGFFKDFTCSGIDSFTDFYSRSRKSKIVKTDWLQNKMFELIDKMAFDHSYFDQTYC